MTLRFPNDEEHLPSDNLEVPAVCRDGRSQCLRSRNRSSEEPDVEMEASSRSNNNNEDADESKRRTHQATTRWKVSARLQGSRVVQTISPCIKLACRYRRFSIPIVTLFLVWVHWYTMRMYRRYIGKHPLDGGRYGQRIDRFLVYVARRDIYKRRKQEFDRIGVDFPRLSNAKLASMLDLHTNAALREQLVRQDDRSKALKLLEDSADGYQKVCLTLGAPHLLGDFFESSSSSHLSLPTEIPRYLFVPQKYSPFQYGAGNVKSFQHTSFREMDMRAFVKGAYPSLLETFDSFTTQKDREWLWALVIVYHFGGLYVGNPAMIDMDAVNDILQSKALEYSNRRVGIKASCIEPVGIVALERMENQLVSGQVPAFEVALIAATPRHPHFRCFLDRLKRVGTNETSSALLSVLYGGDSWEPSSTFQVNTTSRLVWEEIKTHWHGASGSVHECAQPQKVGSAESFSANTESSSQKDQAAYVYVVVRQARESVQVNFTGSATSTVRIRERKIHKPILPRRKVPLRSILQSEGIEPGWMCSRCLKAAVFGTLGKCAFICPPGYEEFICHVGDNFKTTKTVVDVQVDVNQVADARRKRIPSIIHQTWFEEITADKYPQLARLQNSWANSGWEYRFYDDEDARQYIARNFPQTFVEAYDAVIPGAFKADLFRYLVLLKDGGIYADIDILLEANLDTFVTPNLSFFAPRDSVVEYADEAFCLWNGIIGSEPGHPFLVRAVERLVNLIIHRADFYDLERDLCRRNGNTMENWKVRAEPHLFLSGPCALGISMNEVLNRTSLDRIDIGSYPDSGHGGTLILVVRLLCVAKSVFLFPINGNGFLLPIYPRRYL
jgi:mannosyltransferase OCH1-like enzyme